MQIITIIPELAMRLGLRLWISQKLPDAPVLEVNRFFDSLDTLKTNRFDMVFIDMEDHGPHNLWMVQLIRLLQPGCILVATLGKSEDAYAYTYIQAGADGILNRKASYTEFVSMFKIIRGIGKYVSNAVQESFLFSYLDTLKGRDRAVPVFLSEMELNVIQLLMLRHTSRAVAGQLNLPESSVLHCEMKVYYQMTLVDRSGFDKLLRG